MLAGIAMVVVGLGGAAASVFAQGNEVEVTVSDFNIAVDPSSTTAGDVTFNVSNTSTGVTHEFVVVKTDVAEGLFPKSDDDPNKVDEEAVGEVIGEIEDIEAGTSATTTLNLSPGKYVFICNLPGHYALGMHVAFTVTEAEAEATATAEPETMATAEPETTAAPEAQATEAPVVAPAATGSGGLLDRHSGNAGVFALIVVGIGLSLIGVTAIRSRGRA
jgi:uncharacterized cupredoxin-like copper-binding protein